MTASAPWRIALTAGEPAGVGAELLVRIAQQGWPARLIAIADPDLLRQRATDLGLPLHLEIDRPPSRDPLPAGHLALCPLTLAAPVQAGTLDSRNAQYVLDMLALAAHGAVSGDFDAIVTAPVHKSILDRPQQRFSGHTEFFQARAGVDSVLMLLVAPAGANGKPLRVALATTHLPLRAVADAIDGPTIERCVHLLVQSLRRDQGLPQPRVSVLGLNPHAGEDGHLGDEEQRIIIPALQRLRAQGFEIAGPLPADTAFTPSRLAATDAYLAMYHDQGLPVLKYAGFGHAVNVTLGLPYVRTSVDHGTALDIAGQGRADPGSLQAALHEALRMLAARAEQR